MRPKIESLILPAYKKVMNNVLKANNGNIVKGYKFTDEDKRLIGQYYNKALYISKANLPEGVPILNSNLNYDDIQDYYFEKAAIKNSGIVVVDNILSPETYATLQQYLLESTIYYEAKRDLGTYTGAYLDAGLHHPLLLQVAD